MRETALDTPLDLDLDPDLDPQRLPPWVPNGVMARILSVHPRTLSRLAKLKRIPTPMNVGGRLRWDWRGVVAALLPK
jgi:hypothetical protein